MLATRRSLYEHGGVERRVVARGAAEGGPGPRRRGEILSNTALEELLVGQPEDVQAEIIRINTDARPRALQAALLVPIVAALLGLVASMRMMRLPDPAPSGAEGMVLG